jgi:hypothetical protein
MIIDHISLYELPETEKRIKPLWWQEKGLSYTASGYGRKIPTVYQVRIRGRWRRVYCYVFSNAGTCYVESGRDWIVVTD